MYTTVLLDMDNTLLQSKINFVDMRHSLIDYAVKEGLAEREDLQQASTPAQVIAHLKRLEGMDSLIELEVWDIVASYEKEGMKQVRLEEGVFAGLEALNKHYRLAVVTNNAYETACLALEETRITPYFEVIVGREQMEALKPSPSGILYALEQLGAAPEEAVMVGDSWIDGKAAQRANVDYVAYKAEPSKLAENHVNPVFSVTHFDQLVNWLVEK